MRNPLATAHKLVINALSKGVAHAAMITGEPHAAADGGGKVLDFFLLDLRHCNDRHDQAHVDDAGIGEGFGGVLDIDFEALAFENLSEDMGTLFRLMAAPSAPDNQRFTHLFPPHALALSSERIGRGRAASFRKHGAVYPTGHRSPSSIQFARLEPRWHRLRALGARYNRDRGAPVRGCLKRLHDLKYVEGEFAAGAVRTALADRLRHVREAKDAMIAVGIRVLDRDLTPVFRNRGNFDLPPEIIGVRHDQGTLLAVKLDRRVPVPRDVEAHGHRDHGAALE